MSVGNTRYFIHVHQVPADAALLSTTVHRYLQFSSVQLENDAEHAQNPQFS